MSWLAAELVALVATLRHPRSTVRGRLMLLISGVLFASGALLLAVTYAQVAHRGTVKVVEAVPSPESVPSPEAVPSPEKVPSPGGGTAGPGKAIVEHQHLVDLNAQLAASGVALALMAVFALVLGWLVAGRVLRPLRTVTAAAQQISAEHLDRRLAVKGPRDELKELGDTIDGLLGRLQDSFDAQRRFVANASHELRTPLTVSRALLEMIIEDPHATVESFRATCRQVLEEGEQQEQLIDSLLVLARSQRGLERREPLDLALVTADVLRAHEADASARGLRFEQALEPAPLSGDRRLIERLVSNLVENALRHNIPGGRVRVTVGSDDAHANLAVKNTGPIVPPEDVERLLQPFQRMSQERTGEHDGLGLGLSIVQAIAGAHDASLAVRAEFGGGLEVEVSFPARRSRQASIRHLSTDEQ
jgi:signal transduction histidine kinase